MTSTESAAPIDTRQMAVIHSFFRREFRLAGGVVRRAAPGDVDRAEVVADHLEFIGRALHSHHTIEDELLWPLLLERIPTELAPIVRLMEDQHRRVDGLLASVGELLPRWRAEAGSADRDSLADTLDSLYVRLVEHLDAEEDRLLPLAARAVTQDEWDALGERGRGETPRHERALVLGMFQHDGNPEVLAGMLRSAPAPIRFLLPRLARRAFRRHSVQVHGTPSP